MAERTLPHRLLGPPKRLVGETLSPVSEWLSIRSRLLRRELRDGVELPWRRRLWLYRRGFTSRDGQVFRVDESNYRDTVSSLQHERANDVTEPWDAAVDNGLTFRLLFGGFSSHLPALYGLVDGGTLTRNSPLMTVPSWQADDPAGSDGVARFEATSWITSHLDEADALVLRPVHGDGGTGVLVCRTLPDRDGYDVDGERKTPGEFRDLVEGLEEYLAWAFVRQAEYADRIYPGATAAIRVLTLWDYERDEPFVAGAAQRIGSDASAPIDSPSRGGLTAAVGDEGELGPAARWHPDTGEVRWHRAHPDTGERIEGTRVPGWDAVRERVLEMAAAFPHLPRLGWDVVVTDDGAFVVLEVDAHADDVSVQIHRPLLRDPRVRAFYEHHGCL